MGRPSPLNPKRKDGKPGRPPGGKNKLTLLREKTVSDVLAGRVRTPLQVFIGVMNGTLTVTPLQLKAAELAAPYCHPKLMSIAARHSGANGGPVVLSVGTADPIEAARIYAKLMDPVVTAAATIEHEEEPADADDQS